MFDRPKASPAADQPGKPANDVRPAPGGFGRRQTPIGQAHVGQTPISQPPAAPAPANEEPESVASLADSAADLKKLAQVGARIAQHLMQVYRDPRGIHVETVVGAAAVLAGEFALRASAPQLPDSGLPDTGWIAGAPADALIYGGSDKIPVTLWSVVQVVMLGLGIDRSQMPDLRAVAERASANLGAAQFPPKLSVPPQHYPHEFSPNAAPRHRDAVVAIAREAGLDPTQTALALAFTVALLIKNAHAVVPAPVLASLAAELMIAVTRMAPLKAPVE
jgi:hypothetical protein